MKYKINTFFKITFEQFALRIFMITYPILKLEGITACWKKPPKVLTCTANYRISHSTQRAKHFGRDNAGLFLTGHVVPSAGQ